MTPPPFPVLYTACLGLCVGSIELAVARLDLAPPPPPPQEVERVAVAVPPRPDGVRPVQGEGDAPYRYTEEGCKKLEGQFRDICFHQLARQRAPTDLEGGLEACRAAANEEITLECSADVAELYSPADRVTAMAVCPTITSKKWRDQCVFGISLAIVGTDPEWAFRNCDNAGMWHDFCRHDVNGETSQTNVDLALAHCAEEEGDLLRRKTCWHGIGKYIARLDVDAAKAACERVPLGPDNLYRENCFHGLGWGAAEKGGAEFAYRCGLAGPQEDSCKVGVAYQLKRLEPAKALDICATVRRDDLRSQCQSFIRTGNIR